MRLIIERSLLLKALQHVTSVVERRTTIPILSNVLLTAKGGALALAATDLEMSVVEQLPCEVADEGAGTISAHVIHDIVRKLPDGAQAEIFRSGDDGRLTLKSGQAEFALQALPPDDFPQLNVGEWSHSFTIEASALKRLIEKTRFAISTEETRYYLNGIYLHQAPEVEPPVLRAVATDGHRLAQMDVALPDGAEDMPGVIVPRKTVAELHKLLGEEEGEVQIELSKAKMRFRINAVTLTSKLIEGTFPDYARVIPEGNDKSLDVANAEFANAVDRVSTLSSEKGRAVKLHIAEGRLVLSVNNPDSGSATEELAVGYESDPIEIGFNARYLLDISNQLESETVHFLLADPGSPTMVRDTGEGAALYVLMPMRV